jgi:hypothetical protein
MHRTAPEKQRLVRAALDGRPLMAAGRRGRRGVMRSSSR